MKPFFVFEVIDSSKLPDVDLEMIKLEHGEDYSEKRLISVVKGPECSCEWCEELKRKVAAYSEEFYRKAADEVSV